MKRGKYVTFEGGEGTGTTTHTREFCNFLTTNKIPNIWTREPGGTEFGMRVRSILLDPDLEVSPLSELFLFEADRVDQYENIVKPSLEKGVNVISDRSWPSTEVYQGTAGKVDINLIKQLNRLATQGINPDLLFIIDGDPRELLKRETDPDRFAAKGLEYHKKVRQGYLDILNRYPEFAVKINYRNDDINGMQEEIRGYVKDRLNLP